MENSTNNSLSIWHKLILTGLATTVSSLIGYGVVTQRKNIREYEKKPTVLEGTVVSESWNDIKGHNWYHFAIETSEGITYPFAVPEGCSCGGRDLDREISVGDIVRVKPDYHLSRILEVAKAGQSSYLKSSSFGYTLNSSEVSK